MANGTKAIQGLLGGQNFSDYEREVVEKHQLEAEKEIISRLEGTLKDDQFLQLLKTYGQQVACRFIGWRKILIRLSSGRKYEVISPVFLRSKPKDKRRRRRRSNVTRHLGLEVLGFEHKCSPLLLHNSIQMAALCPSFETASNVLEDLGVQMNQRLLQTLCYRVADRIMVDRCDNVVDDSWERAGLRLLVCIDGGRIRHRQVKRGRKKKGMKRHGYSTDWVAPWLITITCVDENGKKRPEIAPIYDGTVKDINGAFELLEGYLEQINLKGSVSLTFCADGGNGIWERIKQLEKKLAAPNIYRVLDYTHAKQNLTEIVDLIHQGCGAVKYEYTTLMTQLKALLWQGKIDGIESIIYQRLHKKRNKKQALKKLHDYFGDIAKFQYQTFRAAGLPVGSGTVESAIRRVINLRIKGAGLFWKLENVERMIFLRSQVLSGRWHFTLNAALDRVLNTPTFSVSDCYMQVA